MQENPEIIFLFPNHENGNLDYHLGVNYIISYLRSRNIYAEQFVNNKLITLKDLLGQLLCKNPKAIGFTCYESNYYLIKFLAKELKEKNPGLLVVVGGPTATFSDKTIMSDCPWIDICVRGEGEQTTYEIIENLKSGINLTKIPGLTLRKNNQIFQTPERPLIKDDDNKKGELDILPSPYLTVLNPKDFLEQNGNLALITSRGCVYNCIYCTRSPLLKYTIRYHSIERVISELKVIKERIKEQKIRINIYDTTFTLNRKRTIALCNSIIEEKLGLVFSAQTRSDCVDVAMLKLLFKAGFEELSLGLESAVPRVLYNLKKVRAQDNNKKDGFRPEKKYILKTRKIAVAAKKIGIITPINIILGLPGETLKDALKTMRFVKKLNPSLYNHNTLRVYPGTTLAKIYEKDKPWLFRNLLLSFPYKPSYNLNKVRPLKNDLHRLMRNSNHRNMSIALRCALIGLYRPDEINSRPRDIILVNRGVPQKWSKEFIPMTARIFTIGDKNLLSPTNKKNRAFKITLGGYAFEYFGEKNKYYFTANYLSSKNIFSFIKFSTFINNKNLARKLNRNIIFDIENHKDMEKFKNYLTFNRIKQVFNSYKNSHCNYIMLDRCRWHSYCPATNIERLIIETDKVLPCFRANPIGRIGDGLDKMQRKFLLRMEEEKIKRGCAKCKVRNMCSKCTYLGEIEAVTYCNFRKQFGNILLQFIGRIELNMMLAHLYAFPIK